AVSCFLGAADEEESTPKREPAPKGAVGAAAKGCCQSWTAEPATGSGAVGAAASASRASPGGSRHGFSPPHRSHPKSKRNMANRRWTGVGATSGVQASATKHHIQCSSWPDVEAILPKACLPEARILPGQAIQCVPQNVALWLALAKLSSYKVIELCGAEGTLQEPSGDCSKTEILNAMLWIG
ncbi:unnamed protein product, partial [Symbiodinium pilosum]